MEGDTIAGTNRDAARVATGILAWLVLLLASAVTIWLRGVDQIPFGAFWTQSQNVPRTLLTAAVLIVVLLGCLVLLGRVVGFLARYAPIQAVLGRGYIYDNRHNLPWLWWSGALFLIVYWTPAVVVRTHVIANALDSLGPILEYSIVLLSGLLAALSLQEAAHRLGRSDPDTIRASVMGHDHHPRGNDEELGDDAS